MSEKQTRRLSKSLFGQIVFLHPAPQGGTVDAEFLSNQLATPFVAAEERVQEFFRRFLAFCLQQRLFFLVSSDESGRKMLYSDLSATAEDDCLLHNIKQFANVTRIIMGHQKLNDFGRKTTDIFPVGSNESV